MKRPLRLALALLAVALSGCGSLRVLFPAKDYDEIPPELPADLARPAFLVFSKTNGFRHEEAIPAGIDALRELAARRGWGVHATENGAVHNPEDLARFDALVWLHASGPVLNEAQREAFESYLTGGGGFVGIHGSGGDFSYDWPWYVETVIGAQFIGHPGGGDENPQLQEATVRVEDRAHPATRHLDPLWARTDEWYSFEASPRARGVRVLASLDESSYAPYMRYWPFIDRDLAMGDDHPVVWSHCVGEGRVVYSALGHQGRAYTQEPAHLQLLAGAIQWAMGLDAAGCEHPIGPPSPP